MDKVQAATEALEAPVMAIMVMEALVEMVVDEVAGFHKVHLVMLIKAVIMVAEEAVTTEVTVKMAMELKAQ